MKKKTVLGVALFGAMFAIPAWTHHAAEGIISDELWDVINDRLVDMDSPHLIIFEDMIGSMRIDEAPEGGSMFLVSSVTVAGDEDDCLEYLIAIEDVLSGEDIDWMHDPNNPNVDDVVSGAYSYNNSFLPWLESPDTCVCNDAECSYTFSIWEPIGSVGWADDADEIYDPPEAPGPSAQQGKRGK